MEHIIMFGVSGFGFRVGGWGLGVGGWGAGVWGLGYRSMGRFTVVVMVGHCLDVRAIVRLSQHVTAGLQVRRLCKQPTRVRTEIV